MLFVGVDLGTSAVKLLLMDENGKIKNIVSKEYPLYFPHPGWSEQKPEDWFAQSMEGLKELLEGFDKDQVKGISFGGQMHGLVALDKEDKVIRPAILWNDGRTASPATPLSRLSTPPTMCVWTIPAGCCPTVPSISCTPWPATAPLIIRARPSPSMASPPLRW